MKARRLGRGLDFLLSGTGVSNESGVPAEDVDVDLVRSNPWQPRQAIDPATLEELIQSIRRHGVMQPIIVRPKGDSGYELVAGERRLVAARSAGLKRIPAVVRDIADQEMLVLALVENIQRQDLNAVERATAFKRLADEQKLSHQEIADAAGLARSTVTNAIRVLELDEASLHALSTGKIGEGHARALLVVPDLNRRRAILDSIINDNISVRKIEDKVSIPPGQPTTTTHKAARSSVEGAALERRLRERLGVPVRIEERGRGGRIVIKYSTLVEFDRLFTALVGVSPDTV